MEYRHRLGLRALAVGALALCSVAFYAVVTGGVDGEPAAASAAGQIAALAESVSKVSAELAALRPGRRAARARRAVLAAVRARDEAAAWLAGVRASGARLDAADRLDKAVSALHDWLDAVGSTLSNPNSPRRHHLLADGRRARAAFASLPDAAGLASALGGEAALLRFAAARR